jgi:hypothetical protein
MTNETPVAEKLPNIQAAREYVVSFETKVDASAKIALEALKKALVSTSTKDELLTLAKALEAAQVGVESPFTVESFSKIISEASATTPEIVPEQEEILPPNATAEYIVEKVYETENETLIDGAELLLWTLNEQLSLFSLTPYEKENIKIGILGYVFDHYYEVLWGLKISDLQNIFTDLTKTFSDVTKLAQPAQANVDSLKGKWDAITGLVSGGSDSLGKVTGLLGNVESLDDTVQKNLASKFDPLIQLLTKYRSDPSATPGPDVLTGLLSDPENILNFDKKFPAGTPEELEAQIKDLPQAPKEKTAELAWKLKTVFENKTAILDKVTGTGKNILDVFANSTDTDGPMAWWRDFFSSVLKFLAGLPFIGNFFKWLLGIAPTEDIETYFSDEKRFQRLSAKNLQALNDSGRSTTSTILTGKNLVNVTTKRIAPFTEAYMPLSMDPEQKIPAMTPEMWLSIIQNHQIPIIHDKKQVMIPVPESHHILESDFVSGRPAPSFFDKINWLVEVLSGNTPETPAPITPPEGGTTPGATPPVAPETPVAAPTFSPEGKSQAEIAAVIITQGKALVGEVQPFVEKMENGRNKNFMKTQLDGIITAINGGDIAKVKISLKSINNPLVLKELSDSQKDTLTAFNALITAWEKAPIVAPAVAAVTPPVPAGTTQTTPEKPATPEASTADAGSGWKDRAILGLDWLKSKLS